MVDYEIREYREGDMPSLIETFNEVFGADRTEEQWRYTYERNPAGRRLFVAVADGKAVAQYAARPYRHWMEGEERGFAEIVDSMVHPEHRKGLKAPGLFIRTALPFFPAYGGPNPPADVVHYGWPIESAYRIGQLQLHYNIYRSQTVLTRTPGPGSAELPTEVQLIERFDERVDSAYHRCRDTWGTSTIRDAAFLNWRFVDNPCARYDILCVQTNERVLGYAVYRAGDWMVPGQAAVADWLVPWDEPDVAELLREAVLAKARADGAYAVGLFLPEWSAWFERFQRWGWEVWPTEYYMVGRTFDPRRPLWWLRSHWWYTLADSDLV